MAWSCRCLAFWKPAHITCVRELFIRQNIAWIRTLLTIFIKLKIIWFKNELLCLVRWLNHLLLLMNISLLMEHKVTLPSRNFLSALNSFQSRWLKRGRLLLSLPSCYGWRAFQLILTVTRQFVRCGNLLTIKYPSITFLDNVLCILGALEPYLSKVQVWSILHSFYVINNLLQYSRKADLSEIMQHDNLRLLFINLSPKSITRLGLSWLSACIIRSIFWCQTQATIQIVLELLLGR